MDTFNLSTTSRAEHDQRLVRIANELSDTANVDVPKLLLQLKGILQSHLPGSVSLGQVKKDIWTYDILYVLSLVIRGDFSRLRDGWSIGAQLCAIASQCVAGFTPTEEEEYFGLALPRLVENMLMLGRRLQDQYIKCPILNVKRKRELLEWFRSVLDSLCFVLSAHASTCEPVLTSPWLLHMLITDDTETSTSAISIVTSVVNVDRRVLQRVSIKPLLSVMDEIIYKLVASPKLEIFSSSLKCILVLCRAYSKLVPELCSRYKGLRPHLSRWEGRGLDKELRDMERLLAAGSEQKAELERLDQAATVVQAIWRSYSTRLRLERAKHAIAKFHRTYRRRQKLRASQRVKRKAEKNLEEELLGRRRRQIRDFRQRQLDALHILPATEVERYLEREQQDAAVKIQARYRGYRERQRLGDRAAYVRKIKAAIVVQRAVRKWLQKVRRTRKEPPRFSLPPGLTDERREELSTFIQEHREEHPKAPGSRAQQQALHLQAQELLSQHFSRLRETRRKHQQRETLLAMLEADSHLLMDAPSLDNATEQDVESYMTYSVPIATKARVTHNEELRLLRMPWWKKLGLADNEVTREHVDDYRVF